MKLENFIGSSRAEASRLAQLAPLFQPDPVLIIFAHPPPLPEIITYLAAADTYLPCRFVGYTRGLM